MISGEISNFQSWIVSPYLAVYSKLAATYASFVGGGSHICGEPNISLPPPPMTTSTPVFLNLGSIPNTPFLDVLFY